MESFGKTSWDVATTNGILQNGTRLGTWWEWHPKAKLDSKMMTEHKSRRKRHISGEGFMSRWPTTLISQWTFFTFLSTVHVSSLTFTLTHYYPSKLDYKAPFNTLLLQVLNIQKFVNIKQLIWTRMLPSLQVHINGRKFQSRIKWGVSDIWECVFICVSLDKGVLWLWLWVELCVKGAYVWKLEDNLGYHLRCPPLFCLRQDIALSWNFAK